MDQTMAIIVSATVLMAVGLGVLVTFSGSIDGFQTDTSSIKSQGCNYQQERSLQNPDLTGQVSQKCNTDEFRQKQQERSIVDGALSELED